MVKNILGNGIDIPLLGLREASREIYGDVHELFKDESYAIANCFLLSTSQVGGLIITYLQHNFLHKLLHILETFFAHVF